MGKSANVGMWFILMMCVTKECIRIWPTASTFNSTDELFTFTCSPTRHWCLIGDPVKNGNVHGQGIYLTTEPTIAARYAYGEGNRYIMVADLCVTKVYFRMIETASALNITDKVFTVYMQPDKMLVRPQFV